MSNTSMIDGHIDEPKGMSDEDIKEALKCCLSSNELIACWKCPAVKLDICCDGSSKISNGIVNKVIDLIKRLKYESKKYRGKCQSQKRELTRLYAENKTQKAEIERLKEGNREQKAIIEAIEDTIYPLPFETDFSVAIKKAKAEAIKEFAERLKKELKTRRNKCKRIGEKAIIGNCIFDIDNLVKEMVGD